MKQNRLRLFLLGLAVLFSFSRCAIGGALIVLFLLSSRFRKMIVWFLPAISIIGILFFAHLNSTTQEYSAGIFNYDDYRKFTLEKSLEVFKDHPYFGVGAGMYGGHISLRYNSPIYAKYGFDTGKYFDYLHDRVGSIEQQWLQVLTELGIVGMLLFTILLITPIFILRKLLKKQSDAFFKALSKGLMIMPFQMVFYMVAFTVSQQQEWLVPYFAFVGMFVGAQRRRMEDESLID